ncbi:hypothetical protein [Streptomyces hydrogenans]|uniref:hypothetical protein n=1 Tax=Streptomyces hydrogenans TaxID=1873719 RepID=UPI003D7088D5
MTSHHELRLLPWTSPDGKPCLLSTDDSDSRLSRLADSTEATQLNLAAGLMHLAAEELHCNEVHLEDLRSLVADLVDALHSTLRVAESRGQRLFATR